MHLTIHWPQAIILIMLLSRMAYQLHGDYQCPDDYERKVGVISSLLANGLPLVVLYLGGFFDQH